MNAETLIRAMPGLPADRAAQLVDGCNDALRRTGCTTVDRAAMFLAQVGHESVSLQFTEEIASGEAYNGRTDLGNTQPGDGPRYKGHGVIQVTGRANHASLSRWAYELGLVPTPTYFVDHPLELTADKYVWLGAIWYWIAARPMNTYADRRDIVGATRAVNGGLNGLDDRQNRWQHCLSLGDAILPSATERTFGEWLMAHEDTANDIIGRLDRIEKMLDADDADKESGRLMWRVGRLLNMVQRQIQTAPGLKQPADYKQWTVAETDWQKAKAKK